MNHHATQEEKINALSKELEKAQVRLDQQNAEIVNLKMAKNENTHSLQTKLILLENIQKQTEEMMQKIRVGTENLHTAEINASSSLNVNKQLRDIIDRKEMENKSLLATLNLEL